MSNKTTTQYMPSNGLFPTWEHAIPNVGTYHSQRGNIPFPAWEHLRTLCLSLLMVVLGSEMAWGQDYSGVYYIASNGYNVNKTTTNYYLCPTEGWCYYAYTNQDDFTSEDNGKPFLTTYQCRNGNYNVNEKAIWIVEKKSGTNFYYIKRAFDGKYIVFNGQIRTTSNADRMRVHLEAMDTPNDNALFIITPNGNAYNIQAKADPNAKYWTVNGGNKDALTGQSGKTAGPTGYTNTAGIIGIYQDIDANSNFYFEKATVDPPTITNNYDGTFTITAASGATIYYTTNGDTPTTSTTTTGTTSVNVTQTESMTVIKAIAKGANDAFASGVTTYNLSQCAKPTITINNGNVTISCATEGATIHYTTDGNPATSSSTVYNGPFAKGNAATFRAIATKAGYLISNETTLLTPIEVSSSTQITNMSGRYILASDFSSSGSIGTSENPFRGIIDGAVDGELITRTLSYPLVAYADGATIKNVILDDINITSGNSNGNTGAICNEATGATRIYNCGVLATTSSTISGSGHVGSIVGSISGNTRVINCYSFATVNGGTYTAGIVGYNPVGTTQANVDEAGMVMNCMFYGNITGSNISPVYGGELIDNAGETGINNYNYYRRNRYDKETDTYVDDVTFDNSFSIDDYHRSWPADAKYLTRFEYYRSILNSNKKLCTWWVSGTNGTAPSDADIEDVGIAKWVLDLSIAPYPILKKWGKYPSVINQDPDKRVNPSTKTWVSRDNATDHWGKDMAPDTEGQILGTVNVTINAGSHHSGSTSKSIKITAMDTEYNDYCYGKIQLPYYNEIFGNPNGNSWSAKYGDNYTDQVVTGWDVAGGSDATDFNLADRNSYNGRVYAQGGYFYVPKGVTSISITAHWADAVYVCNKDYSIDRVNVGAGEKKANNDTEGKKIPGYGSSFAPAGTIPETFQNQPVYTSIQEAIGALSKTSNGKDVYNQAIVLIGNVQVRNHSYIVNLTGNNSKPFTLMSADLDFDNEPDNCLQLQFRNDIDRPGVQPIRFDFLPVPELGLAIRTNKLAYAIGIMIPLGHFEITETAFMHTTQFEYDANVTRTGKSPVIINGGEHEMFTKRYQAGTNQRDRTSYFLLGGNAWVHRFAPGAHPNTGQKPDIYLFPVNVIGGQVKELYLTGLYRPELPASGGVIAGAPRCYIDGGKFDIIAGAGYDKVSPGEDVTFKINHSLIKEFYGGGINASNPVSGNIDVTINNSKVDKYCGGPKVGVMANEKTVTTHATGTTFGVFYGGGNGGNSYYRQLQRDGDFASDTMDSNWESTSISTPYFNFNGFTPLGVKDDGTDNKGYHAEYEFEVFNQSNGLSDEVTQRGFIKWIQFGETATGDVESILENCKVLGNFYGGGNLATVNGNVTSTLTNTKVDGSVFGAGYSAAIPTFQVHDKANRVFPLINDAGIITEGHIPYAVTEYEWTNEKLEGKDDTYMKAHPTYSKEVGGETKWYCYTWNSLENLGAVTGDVTLTIDGNTVADENGKVMTVAKSVYGGGEESDVLGNTSVTMTGGYVFNGIFGGGYSGSVGTVTARSLVNYDGTAHTSHPGCVGGKPTAFADNTGKCTVVVTGGQIGPIEVATKGMTGTGGPVPEGWVWGGGCGIVADPATDLDTDFRTYVKETDVTIGGTAFILESIIGGGEFGRVLGDTHVTIQENCQIGVGYQQEEDGRPKRYANEKFVNPATTPITNDNALAPCSHYDYDKDNPLPYDPYYDDASEAARIGTASTANPTDGKTWIGCVFGGGSGYMPYKKADDSVYGWIRSAGVVEGNTLVEIKGGHILTNVYGGNEVTDVKGKCTVRMTGGTIGVPRTLEQIKDNPFNGNLYGAGKGDPRTYFNEFTNVGSVEVDVSGGIIYGSVYGGGEDGHVTGNVTTTIRKETGEGKVAPVIGCDGTSGDDGNVFGAGQGSTVSLTSGVVSGNVELNIQDGNIKGSVYGGGQIGSVGTYVVSVDHENYGKMKEGDDHGCLTVNLTGGTIEQNVYGGCMGTTKDVAFGVSKNVAVNLNKDVDDAAQGCAVKGSIFGCNNVNSSPQGTATVHVYKTQRAGKSRITNSDNVTDAKVPGTQTNGEFVLNTFDVQAVYGGGNLAAYTPLDATSTYEEKKKAAHTTVIIDGCGRTSIGQVYGGGNAASTPATEVTVNGTFEIGEVFGGGNGKDAIGKDSQGHDIPNPGANVGFYDYSAVETEFPTKEDRQDPAFKSTYVYGSGQAAVNIYGGTIHRVFGGSNTKGNVRITAVTMLEDKSTCDFCVDEAYGGGKSAPMDAEAKLLMSCVPGLNVAYGGAQAADVQNNVILNITNGTFDRVFGGNNISGTIRGSITVNIEETGCKPIIIGELYGGGNLAGYSVYGYDNDDKPIESGTTPLYNDPQVNVKSFTSIGDIYGGGYGESAVMVGSPTVNIDVVNGRYYDNANSVLGDNAKTPNNYPVPSHAQGKMGAINNVFGGGNAAKVIGNTNVNIGTQEEVYVVKTVTVGDSVTDYFTRNNDGTYTAATGTAVEGTTYYEKKTVLGADIRGNVYGGGNAAEVTGKTNVTIGKKKETE